MQLPTKETGAFLNYVSSRANITQFVETVPSANDIFIKAIEEKNKNNS